MKLLVPRTAPHPQSLLLKAGYVSFHDPNTKEHSFVLRLTGDFYPRFHVYVKEQEDSWVIDLHLDQKKPSYGDSTMHSGEYDGPTVEREMARIGRWAEATGAISNPTAHQSHSKKQESFTQSSNSTPFGGIFG